MHEGSFTIEGLGGRQVLKGKIPVFGSKNEALAALVTPLLFRGPVSFENVPEIEDVRRVLELLESIGAEVKRVGHGKYIISADGIKRGALPPELAGRLRASLLFVGPLLGRGFTVSLPYPGGDTIGARPIDLSLAGLEKMGAHLKTNKKLYIFSAPKKLSGAEVFFRNQSVTGTEMLLMTAVLARGKTVLKNTAREPEVVHLASFLKKAGARIEGIGTDTLIIEGGKILTAPKKPYVIMPDRLETGTFLILAVLSGKDITITQCEPAHIEVLTETLRASATSDIEIGKTFIRVQNKKKLRIKPIDIKTHEYPGFPTDFQSPFVVLLTQAEGKSLMFETIYEERFNYLGNLIQMNAKIVLYDPHRARIHGKTPLRGVVSTSPDIRAGLGYILAAIVAKGQSVIHNVYVIDRGYEVIEERLAALGVSIVRN